MIRFLNLRIGSFNCSNVSTEGSTSMNVNFTYLTRKGETVVGHAGKCVPLMLKK